MAADASHIDLTACDSVGNVFYTYRFMLDGSDRSALKSMAESQTAAKVLIGNVMYLREPDGRLYTLTGARRE